MMSCFPWRPLAYLEYFSEYLCYCQRPIFRIFVCICVVYCGKDARFFEKVIGRQVIKGLGRHAVNVFQSRSEKQIVSFVDSCFSLFTGLPWRGMHPCKVCFVDLEMFMQPWHHCRKVFVQTTVSSRTWISDGSLCFHQRKINHGYSSAMFFSKTSRTCRNDLRTVHSDVADLQAAALWRFSEGI